jgi:hypothetical protein
MQALLIVKAQVGPQSFPCLTGTDVIFEVDLLIIRYTPDDEEEDRI